MSVQKIQDESEILSGMVFGFNDEFYESISRLQRTLDQVNSVKHHMRAVERASEAVQFRNQHSFALDNQFGSAVRALTAFDHLDQVSALSSFQQTLNAVDDIYTPISNFEQAIKMQHRLTSPPIFQVVRNVQRGLDQIEALSFDFDQYIPEGGREVPTWVIRQEVEAYSPIVAYTLSKFASDLWESLTGQEQYILVGLVIATVYGHQLVFSDMTVEDLLYALFASAAWSLLGETGDGE